MIAGVYANWIGASLYATRNLRSFTSARKGEYLSRRQSLRMGDALEKLVQIEIVFVFLSTRVADVD